MNHVTSGRSTATAKRRGLLAAFALTAAGGAAVATLTMPATPSATAATDPCAASEVAKTIVGAKPKAAIVRDLEDFIAE